jgi:ABC-type nitrate/sulfonate/bicarbonate transport system substrate-binding protein
MRAAHISNYNFVNALNTIWNIAARHLGAFFSLGSGRRNIRMKFVSAGLLMAIAISAADAQQLREVKFGLSTTSLPGAGPRLAYELGLFKKHGLEPQFVQLESSNGATSALIGKSIPVTMSGPGETIIAQARGQDVVWIATAYQNFAANIVLSNSAVEKLNIAATAPVEDRLKALDNMLIATTSATSATTVAFKSAAEAEGAKMRWSYMPQQVMANALEARAIDGYISVAPFWGIPVTRGIGVVWIDGPKGELPSEFTPATNAVIQMMRATAESDPALVKAIAAVFADLGVMIEQHPDRVKAAVTKLFSGLDRKTFELVYATDYRGWQAPPPSIQLVDHEIAVMKSSATGELADQIGKLDPRKILFSPPG